MDLILWRHAEAEDTTPDMARALTPKGQKQARRMAEWLDSQLPEGCRILVSPAVRTLQTVEPLGRKFKTVSALAPGATAGDVLRAANWPASREPVLVVGHQPTLGQVAALLMSGQEQYWEMKKASVWWLTQKDGDSVVVKAVMTFEMLGKQK